MLPGHTCTPPVSLFFGYAQEDEHLQKELRVHFATMRREGLINYWDRSHILAGENSKEEIENQLHTADIILLLISAYFLNSDYCYSVIMARAMERY